MSDAKKLQATDVKIEVKRIKKLPKDEQKERTNALCDRIKTEIDTYYDEISTMSLSEKKSEYLRITSCIWALRFKWEMELVEYLNKKRSEQSDEEQKELQEEDVANEVKRIEKLPPEEREARWKLYRKKSKERLIIIIIC